MNTTTLRAIIVDDEPLARQQLRRLLRSDDGVEIVDECGSGEEAVRQILTHRPDVVLLDVQMPGLDGFDVIASVNSGGAHPPAVIFVTAHEEYAVRALRTHAVDYLLKPVEPADLAAAIARVRVRRSTGDVSDMVARLDALLRGSGQRYARRLISKVDGRTFVIPTSDVDWIEARDDAAIAHVVIATHPIARSLTALAEQLDPAMFARIHRSTIVNLERVREVQPWFKGEQVVLLKNGTRLTVGPTYRPSFLQSLRGL